MRDYLSFTHPTSREHLSVRESQSIARLFTHHSSLFRSCPAGKPGETLKTDLAVGSSTRDIALGTDRLHTLEPRSLLRCVFQSLPRLLCN
jgi:hypothetical protein